MNLSRMRRPPTHPGVAFFEEWIKPRGFGAQAEAARAMHMSTVRLNEVCLGKRPVTPETALLIGALTKTDPRMWLHMQADHDLWRVLQTTDTKQVEPLTAKK